jgi:RNA polymerase sigma-70 factor (ECF subfamily)
LDNVQIVLQREMVADGRGDLFEALKPHLVGDPAAGNYAHVADRLEITEAAVKMAMSRLRKRYRELLRAEIARTVSNEEEIDDEIRNLFDALRRPGE